jgi:hypothetical protein
MKKFSKILKWHVFILQLVYLQLMYAQHGQVNYPMLNITLKNNTLEESIVIIEDNTNYQFYYRDHWFGNYKYNITFENVALNEVLDKLFLDTKINYYIIENKVFLVENTIIKDELPLDFFINLNKSESINETIALKDYVQDTDEIITIGKENRSGVKSKYLVTGYVKSATTNEMLKGVRVFTKKATVETYTDKNGYFSLNIIPGFNTIFAEIEGFQTSDIDVLIYGNGMLTIELASNITQLDEVIIKSDANQNIKKVLPGVVTISVKEIKIIPTILGEMDILKIATTMPGVKTVGEGALGYNVRGGKPDQNLILLDNAVLYNPSHFFGIFSSVNPFSTGSVDIYKGTIPAEYGSRLSSVIDINTKTVNKEKFSGQGNIGPVTTNIALEMPIIKDKTGVLLSFRSTYSDWILKQLKKEDLKNSQVSFYDGIIRLDSDLNSKNQLKATGYYSNDRFSISSDSIYKYGNKLFSVEWKHQLNDNHDLNLQLSDSNYSFGLLYEGGFNNDFDLNYSVRDAEIKLKFNYKLNSKHKFNYGLNTKFYHINPGEISPLNQNSTIGYNKLEKEKGLENALFISDKYDINDKLSVDFGLRFSLYAALGPGEQNIYEDGMPMSESNIIETVSYANNDVIKTYFYPEYRASARYTFSPSFSIKGGYNKSIQFIHMLSSTTSASPIDVWKLSNLNIKPQISHQLSVGLYKNFNQNQYEISAESYFKKMNNTIDFRVGADLFLNENIESELLVGDGKAYGIEFLFKKSGKFNGWIGYTYSRAFLRFKSEYLMNQINNGNYFPANFDKPHDVSLVANYKLTERYSFSLNYLYQTGRPITFPVGQYYLNGIEHVLYSERNQLRIPDYYRLDLGINIEGNHKIKKLAHSFWNISVYNVLGRNNPYSIFFVNEDGMIKAYQSSIFSVPVPTISYNFKF